MKITEKTLDILRNFMKFNNNILLIPGQEFYSREPNGEVIGIASVPEDFPAELGIMDLQSLLSYFKLVKDPDISVEGNKLVISGSGTTVKYTLADKDLIIYHDKRPDIPEDPFIVLDFTEEMLQLIQMSKNIGVVKADTIKFYTSGKGNFMVGVLNSENSASNNVTKEIEALESSPSEFELSFKTDQFVMMERGYKVELYERAIGSDQKAHFARFVSDDVEYLLPCKVNAGNFINHN